MWKCVMKRWWLCVAVLLLAMAAAAEEIPPGTVLPVMLNSTLDARKMKPGHRITARLMQDVVLPGGRRLRAGSRIDGQVISADSTANGSRLVLRMDRAVTQGRELTITTHLRALASMMEVYEAQMPTNNWDDYGTTTSDWTTVQVGGDVVYRGNGHVYSEGQIVGKATDSGLVTAKLRPAAKLGCRGEVYGNDREQSLWVFSTAACGTYGFTDLDVSHAGRSEPIGEIVLASKGNVHIPSGSGMLLRVGVEPASGAKQP